VNGGERRVCVGMSWHALMFLVRLSPTGEPFGNPNPKWVSNTIPIASNSQTEDPLWISGEA